MLEENDISYAYSLVPSRIIKATPCPIDPHTGKINPHVTSFELADGRISSVFHVKPIYYETQNHEWRPLSEVALYAGNHRIVLDASKAWERISFRYLRWLALRQRLLGCELEYAFPSGPYSGVPMHEYATMDSITAYPDPHTEETTIDGWVEDQDGAWANAHGGSGRTTDAGTGSTLLVTSHQGAGVYQIYRSITLFETASIGAGSAITAAIASLYVSAINANTDDDTLDYLQVYASAPASNTAIVIGDFDSLGTAAGSDSSIDYGSISTSAYNNFTLNSTGQGFISLDAITKLGWREGHDATNATVDSSTTNSLTASSADVSDVTQDPKLVVTYTPAFIPGPMGII